MGWNEERLLRWLSQRPRPRGLVGSSGHDAAVLRARSGRPVTCVDHCLEGVHYEVGEKPRRIGQKAVGRALSDLAATAAVPRAITLALSAPAERSEAWLRGVIGAVSARAEELGAELVAGDLACCRGPAGLVVTALGELPGRRRPPGRDRGRAGQVLVLTGAVGGSRLGRHLEIEPRLAQGRWLHERGATAMMDISDGLGLDLSRLARASGLRIELDAVPVHPDAERLARRDGRDPVWHALHDGEDHELIASLAPRNLARVLAEAPRRCPGLRVIGRLRAGRGLYLPGGAGVEHGPRWRSGGWVHGSD